MKLGQTPILSGLTERETEKYRNGVPGLQDVLVMWCVFSRSTRRDFRKSIMILMLSPRRAVTARTGEGPVAPLVENIGTRSRPAYAGTKIR
jgi:type II secretory pathway component GspD/PulD (secretin)